MPYDENVKLVACGWDFTIILSGSNSLWVTGSNLKGCLTLSNCSFLYSFKPIMIPIENIIKIVAGVYHVLAITGNKKLFGWGDSKKNKLGFSNGIIYQPTEILLPEPYIIDVAAGLNTTIILGASGSVYTSSNNGIFTCFYKIECEALACIFSTWHSYFIQTEKVLMGWGRNNFGQISTKYSERIKLPTIINDLPFQVENIQKVLFIKENNLYKLVYCRI